MEWDTDVAQILMKNCPNEGSDNALESPSLAKLVPINFSGVRGYLGAKLTSLSSHIWSMESEGVGVVSGLAQISIKKCISFISDCFLDSPSYV